MAWKRYPAYRDSGVAWLGEVPEGWQIRKLRYIAAVNFSTVDKKSEDGEEPVRLCNYVDVYHNDTVVADLPYMEATATPLEIDRFTLKAGDVLVTKDSEDWEDIAVPAYVPHDVDGVLCGYHLAQIRSNPDIIYGDYLFRCFLSESVNSQFKVAAHGIMRYGIGKDAFHDALLPVPPLSEQHTIAAFLERGMTRIDALIAKKERLIGLLQEKRAALISRAVTKGLDASTPMKDSGIAWLGEVPAHWETLKLTRVASLHSGHTPSRLHPEYWKTCTIPWISLGDVWQLRSGKMEYIEETKEKISELGLRNSAAELLPPGTVILSRTASVGFSGIMATSMATTQDYANWVCGPRILPEYLLQVLRCMKQEFERLMMGSTHQTIYMPDIAAFRIPLPPIKEQQEIVQNVRSLQQRSERLEDAIAESIRLAQEYRTALISATVTGKIDVRGEVST